jgi:FG-GAP repeat/Bacterial Ig-like domain (group 1)/Right handed beta helix region
VVVVVLLAVPAVAAAASEQAKLTAFDGAAADLFGRSVAVSGDTAVVGAPQDDSLRGSAYVFTRTGSTWTAQAKLTAADGAAFDNFGGSVAVSGDTAVVGAHNDKLGANFGQGSAYVFTRTGSTWTAQAKLTAADGAANDHFGNSVAVSGDTAVVGAWNDEVGPNEGQGSAYVFTRTGSTWTEQAKLAAADGGPLDWFGWSVALSGDTAVLGATGDEVEGNAEHGSAYVFTRTGSTWTEQARLNASDAAPFDDFGGSVAVSGDTAVVGARNDDVGANAAQGSAYVFTRAGSTWTEEAQLTASDGAAFDSFGQAVAANGDAAMVGAYEDNVGPNEGQGSAYVFTRAGSTWTEEEKLTASDGAADDSFGESVALSGDTAVIGADGDDVGTTANQGSAYVFTGVVGPGPRATLSLRPGRASNPVGSEHCVTATLRDAAGTPTPAVTVRFAVTGSVTETGSDTTDANGEAALCYPGPKRPGADAITAFADTNGNGSDDGETEPDADATKTWVPLDHVSCGDVITEDTTLDRDVVCPYGFGEPALTIAADGVTLDLAGHRIEIRGVGVLIEGHDGVTIMNGSIGGPSGLPILIRDGNRNLLDHVSAGGGGAEAVRLEGSDRNRIVGSRFGGEGGGAVLVDGSDRNLIARNTFDELGLGGSVLIRDSDANIISRNFARGGSLANAMTVAEGSDDTTLRRNVLEGPGGRDGIGVQAGTTNTLIVRNRVRGFGYDDGFHPGDGIQVDSPSATLTGNSSNDNVGWGILAVPGVIDGGGNTASGNGAGQCLNVSC